MYRISRTLPVVIASLALVGCGGAPEGGDGASENGASESGGAPVAASADSSSGEAYPELYEELELPELPGGTVTSTGRQTRSLRDGLALRIESPMSVTATRDYYSGALAESGWEESPSRSVPGAPMAGLHATKDGVTFMATITAMGDATQVTLNIHE